MKLQPETWLEKIFYTRNLKPIIDNFEKSSSAPNGYSLGAKLRALFAMIIEKDFYFYCIERAIKAGSCF
ncbi:hypothetical protein [Desulfolucanica intricata]|uniref:hypothetical protein n=1 Tax=Desulfolucanica intricata TaxID=1285191 RepID=UPI000836ACD8|nr:hypothetical protein [Desulfolucanica intricata]